MIIEPKIRNSICLTAHPAGCAAEVDRQIEYIKSRGPIAGGPKKVLVIGASTGYGLASRIAAAFGAGAATIGVAFEKPGRDKGPGTAGFYNLRRFDEKAGKEGLYARSFNGDAFSHELKAEILAAVEEDLGQVDLVVYSLASPARKDPDTGELYMSAIKPIGQSYRAKSVEFLTGEVKETEVPPATEEEIANTLKVMGGEDWELWMKALADRNLLAPGVKTVAYSYIGPEVTKPIYRRGTIGNAKEHLAPTARKLTADLADLKAEAYVSVNKALVTKAAAVIPVVALYISILYKVMKAKGLHEGCIEQMDRLFRDRLYTNDGVVPRDEEGLIRIDDWEMQPEVQAEVDRVWELINSDNVGEYTDLEGYKEEFLKINGFAVAGVDYEAEVSPL